MHSFRQVQLTHGPPLRLQVDPVLTQGLGRLPSRDASSHETASGEAAEGGSVPSAPDTDPPWLQHLLFSTLATDLSVCVSDENSCTEKVSGGVTSPGSDGGRTEAAGCTLKKKPQKESNE